jgi:hypothetical protein
MFEPLCKSLVHWFASSREYEHPDVMCLLDSLLNAAASKNNNSLRELGSDCIAEFAKWTLKHQDNQSDEAPQNIKSLIRRIQSNSAHSDPFKRLSAINCYDKLFRILREEDKLMDIFLFEITHSVLNTIRLSHSSPELSQDVVGAAKKIL